MRSLLVGLALTVALTGCQGQMITGPGQQPGATSNTRLSFGGLNFKPVSQEAAAQLAARQSGAGAKMSAEAAAPMAAGGDAMATSMIAPAPYGHGSYFGGPFGQMKLDSVQEASAAGASGGWAEIQGAVIGPVVADWAADARLVSTNGMLDAEGNMVTGKENYPGENAWRATYASIANNEVLEFTVTPTSTKVVRLKWSPINMDPASLAVDPKAALAKITAAIVDPAFKSKEDALGRDYFFSGETKGEVGIAVPAVMPVDAPAIAPGEPHPQAPKEDPVFELTPGGRWNVHLQAIGNHLVWELHYNPSPETVSQARQPGETYVEPYAYGMVDARTGDVIRLRRPMRVTVPQGGGIEPMPEPKPMLEAR